VTRPAASTLVLDGDQVKLRLVAERVASTTPVHVDWVRFTVIRRHAPTRPVDDLFPLAGGDASMLERLEDFHRLLRQMPDCDHSAAAQASDLANTVAECLGSGFTVACEIRKGHDFYKHRISIEREGSEVGWVGFGASSESPKQRAQARTLHVNVYGAGCTFADHGWNLRLADLCDSLGGTLTRVDLALDFFDGFDGGMERVKSEFEAGLMDVCGKRLKPNMLGDWTAQSRGERSFYFGSKEAGKQTNVYEKGHQLYGVDAGSKWIRVELRYGNKLRDLSTECLRRPADHFAGASDWHAAMLREADAIVVPEPVRTRGRLAIETVAAEVTRNVRWAFNTAAATVAAVFQHADESTFLELVSGTKLPGRLRRFGRGELHLAFQQLSSVGGVCPSPA
jgi:phage replication initiation protein